MSVSAGADSQFTLSLRSKYIPPRKRAKPVFVPRTPAPSKPRTLRAQMEAKETKAKADRKAAAKANRIGKPRTIDLLHKGYSVAGVGRLEVHARRRTAWSSLYDERAPPSPRKRPSSAMAEMVPRTPLSSGRPAMQSDSPLAQRRRAAAESIVVQSARSPHELPLSRATWIAQHEDASENNTLISHKDMVASPPPEPRRDESQPSSPRTYAAAVATTPEALRAPSRVAELRANIESLRAKRADKSLNEAQLRTCARSVHTAEEELEGEHNRLAYTLSHVELVDSNMDGVIDAHEMYAVMEGAGRPPTRAVGGKIAALAVPKHQKPMRPLEVDMYHVGDGDDMQQHEAIGNGWVKVLELSGDVYYHHRGSKQSQWLPPPHAAQKVKDWSEGRGYLSVVTLASMTRRRELIQSGKPAAEQRQFERARLKRESTILRKQEAKARKLAKEKKIRMAQAKVNLKGMAWVLQLQGEAHIRFVKYCVAVQAQWRMLMMKNIYKKMRANEQKMRKKRMDAELIAIQKMQRHVRGFLERKKLQFLLATPFAVYLVLGAPGSGKTVLSQRLAEAHGMTWISPADIVRKASRQPHNRRSNSDDAGVSEDDWNSMKLAMSMGELVPVDKLLPMMALLIKRARLRSPNTAVILDGFPVNGAQWEILERGETPFQSCVMVHTFVCKVLETTAVDRALKAASSGSGPLLASGGNAEDMIYHLSKLKREALPDTLDLMQDNDALCPAPICKVSLKNRIRQGSVKQCYTRATGPMARLDHEDIDETERNIRRKWKGGHYEVNEQIKSAIADKIVDAEKPHMTHWLLTSDERLVSIDTECAIKESFAEMQQAFAMTQFQVQQHISRLSLRLDPHDEPSRKLLQLANCEEHSRLESIKIASLLAQGKHQGEHLSFSEAMKSHQEAYDLAEAGQANEEARQRAEFDVNACKSMRQVARWRPEFPETMMVEYPAGTLLANEWSIPISLDQIKRALGYTETAQSDFNSLVDARIEVEDMIVKGNIAVETWDLDTAIQMFERGLTFDLTARRFMHAHVDEPLMDKLKVSLYGRAGHLDLEADGKTAVPRVEGALAARDARDAVRKECWSCQEMGQAALAAFRQCMDTDGLGELTEHVNTALQHYEMGIVLAGIGGENAHDRDMMEELQLGLKAAETAKSQVEENKMAIELCEKSAADMKKRHWTEALEHARKAADLAHSAGVKAAQVTAEAVASKAGAKRAAAVEAVKKAVESAQRALGLGHYSGAVDELQPSMRDLHEWLEPPIDGELIDELRALDLETRSALAADELAVEAEAALEVRDYETAKAKSKQAMSHGKLLRHHSALSERITELHDRVNVSAEDAEAGFPAY